MSSSFSKIFTYNLYMNPNIKKILAGRYWSVPLTERCPGKRIVQYNQ